MKYRLKKDLPMIKAGIYESHFIKAMVSGNHGLALFINDCDKKKEIYIGKIKNLIPDWIEEVKPREWKINPEVLEAYEITNLDIAQQNIKYIKVREVLD